MIFNLLNLIIKKTGTTESQAALVFWESRIMGYNRTISGYLAAQSLHESGNFKSELYLRSFNAFGMRPALRRKKTQKGETYNNYATYINLTQSVNDRRLWDEMNNNPMNSNETLSMWVDNLKNQAYFTAPTPRYLAAMLSHLNTIEDKIKKGTWSLLFTLIFRIGLVGLLSFYLWKK